MSMYTRLTRILMSQNRAQMLEMVLLELAKEIDKINDENARLRYLISVQTRENIDIKNVIKKGIKNETFF